MSDQQATALETLQSVLDRFEPMIQAADPSGAHELFCFPYRRKFLNREVVIETVAEMQADVGTFARSMQAVGVTQIIYVASRAERIGVNYISGRYTTHFLRNAQSIVPSYETQVVLHRQSDGRWGMQEFRHNLYVTGFPIDLVRVPIKAPELADLPPDDDRRLATDALSIYQRYLDSTAEAIAADRFDAYVDLMAFPYTAHGSELNQTIHGPEDLHPFYTVLRRCHDGEIGDEVRRVAERAEFIGSGLICGYHTGTVYLQGKQTVAPVRSRMILLRQGAVWRLKSVTNSISNLEYPFNMYEPGGELRTELQVDKPPKRQT